MSSVMPPLKGDIIAVRGGGDLATGVIQALARAGMRVAALEAPKPTVIRRTVSLATAVFDGRATVEDISCSLVEEEDVEDCWARGIVPMLVDPLGDCLPRLAPHGLVDAIIAKRNLGTHRGMAPVTLALGPGFSAPQDVDCVIETIRGHDLGRLIFKGSALPNTGIPGLMAGRAAERVIHAPAGGVVKHRRRIGDLVTQGETLFWIGETPVPCPFDGLLRGLIAQGLTVPKGMKVADVDPRADTDCHTISDKARSLGGAALSAYLYLKRRQGDDESGRKQ